MAGLPFWTAQNDENFYAVPGGIFQCPLAQAIGGIRSKSSNHKIRTMLGFASRMPLVASLRPSVS